ncbi:MAG: radical SAM protein [Bacteroidetes bacterium]|nr:radical SAM protein [Bacteroidota bacterium]
MNGKREKTSRTLDFPYVSVPDEINFFIYPPMKSSLGHETFCLKDKLDLDKAYLKEDLFTIYVSIPYCRTKCNSCCCFRGFLPDNADKNSFLNDYLNVLISQIKAYADTIRVTSSKCGAIYIGGGTASVLTVNQVERLINVLKNSFNMTLDIEINLEGNPLDFSLNYLENIKKSGVTRLSIGYQSGQNITLEALNTAHRRKTALESLNNALSVGFEAVNVDLLFNVPGQTFEQWKKDIEIILKVKPESISVGNYVVFPGSKAEDLIKNGHLKQQHDLDIEYEWYLWTVEKLKEYNYSEQVRGIFTQPNHRQKYVQLSCNSSSEILGFGAGAYSFINGYQFTITKDSEIYKNQVKNGLYFEADSLSPKASYKNLMERYIIHNFYSAKLNRIDFYNKFKKDPMDIFHEIFTKLKQHSLVKINDQKIELTELGKKWRKNIYYEFHSKEIKYEQN